MVLRLFSQRTIQQKRGSYGKILFSVGLDEFNGPVSGTPNYFSGKHHGFRLRFSQTNPLRVCIARTVRLRPNSSSATQQRVTRW
jgi:hypothetical protein